MSRILWIADGGCYTGFARVTHAIGDRLVDKGHEVHVLATNFKGDDFDTKVKLYNPTANDPKDTYGQGRFIELLDKLKPDVVVMLNDLQVLLRLIFKNPSDPDKLLAQHFPIISYIPVDGHNLPLTWGPVAELTNPVAMSKFGQEAIPGSQLVYHGVDTDQFWPVSRERPITKSDGTICKTKADCKRSIGISADAFVVGRVDANQGRKDYAALWKALVPVMKKNADIVAYFHCKPSEQRSGTNMAALLSRSPQTMARFRFPQGGSGSVSQQDLNAIYNSFDVFVSTSRGEGFGLTLAEALACGVPVIAQDCSAIPEVVGPGGELIQPQREITVPFGHDQWLADIGAFSEAIEHAYNSRGWRRAKGKAGRDHVVSSFQWDAAADSFHDYAEAFEPATR